MSKVFQTGQVETSGLYSNSLLAFVKRLITGLEEVTFQTAQIYNNAITEERKKSQHNK
jgi:hypothetical protein